MPKFCIDDNLPIGTAYKTRSGKKAIYGGINVIKGYMFSVGSDSYYTDSQGNYNHRGTTLADSNAPMEERLTHLQEELMDAVNYI